ncbi:MAG: CHRD domain-containing protein [Sphingobacteriales bacterium]|nr:MAG: CHRD domain-containing protein [Sphingobacteriales bacterium]
MRTIKNKVIFALIPAIALVGCATVEEAVVEQTSDTYRASLTGAQEPGGGDPDGMGRAEISVADRADQICYDVNGIRNIGPVTGAHIHRGAPGVNGPIVFTLKEANEGGFKGCSARTEWLEDRIEANPSAYYVNIHTAEYPNGAIRGQLGR